MNKAKVITQLFFSILIIILIGGCTGGNQYETLMPVEMSPEKGKYKGTAVSVDRRLILTTQKEPEKETKEESTKEVQGGSKKEVQEESKEEAQKLPSYICAEPFPEGIAALETLHKYNLTARGQTTEKVDSSMFGTNIPFSVHPAVKFYRDGVFALCQGAMNGWVNVNSIKCLEYKENMNNDSVSPFDWSSVEEKLSKLDLEKAVEYQDKFCNQKPFISEFEYQLNELRKAVVDIFDAEARKVEAELEKMREAKKED